MCSQKVIDRRIRYFFHCILRLSLFIQSKSKLDKQTIILLWCFRRWCRLLMRGRLPRERGRTRPPRLQPPVETPTLTAETANTRSFVFVVPDCNNKNNRERKREERKNEKTWLLRKMSFFERFIHPAVQKNPHCSNIALQHIQ